MKKFTFLLSFFLCLNLDAHPNGAKKEYSKELAHYPSPLPDRVVLTWNDDPATTQAVNWRTDVSVKAGLAQLAVANANGRALKPDEFKAEQVISKVILMKLIITVLRLKIFNLILYMLTELGTG